MESPPISPVGPARDRPWPRRVRPSVVLLALVVFAGVVAGLLLWWPSPTPSGEDAVRGAAPASEDASDEDAAPSTSQKPAPAPSPRSDDRVPEPDPGADVSDADDTELPEAPDSDDTERPAAPSSGEGTYAFPIQPPEAASYGRDHHTYPATDIFAACGTPVVAVTDGTVDEARATDEWVSEVDDPATRGGLFVSLVGDDGVRYYASHLESLEPGVVAGARLRAGDPIGRVGRSGNARSTPCHVHFGLSPPVGPGDWEIRRGTVWPWPYLDAWRDGRHESPADEVRSWAQTHLDGR